MELGEIFKLRWALAGSGWSGCTAWLGRFYIIRLFLAGLAMIELAGFWKLVDRFWMTYLLSWHGSSSLGWFQLVRFVSAWQFVSTLSCRFQLVWFNDFREILDTCRLVLVGNAQLPRPTVSLGGKLTNKLDQLRPDNYGKVYIFRENMSKIN